MFANAFVYNTNCNFNSAIACITSKKHAYYGRRSSCTPSDYQSAFYCTLSRELLWCRAITFLLPGTLLLPFITCDKK